MADIIFPVHVVGPASGDRWYLIIDAMGNLLARTMSEQHANAIAHAVNWRMVPPLGVSDHDRANMQDVLISGTWFSADLFRLIKRSDPANRERLRMAYPEHVQALEEWENSPLPKRQ